MSCFPFIFYSWPVDSICAIKWSFTKGWLIFDLKKDSIFKEPRIPSLLIRILNPKIPDVDLDFIRNNMTALKGESDFHLKWFLMFKMSMTPFKLDVFSWKKANKFFIGKQITHWLFNFLLKSHLVKDLLRLVIEYFCLWMFF